MPEHIIGTLSPETCGCIDLFDAGILVHVCDAQPGGILRASDSVCDDNAERGESWRLGTTTRLWPVSTEGGFPPSCKMADYEDPTRTHDIVCLPRAHGPHPEYRPARPGEAAFQWKGTVATMTFRCLCGTECRLDDVDFMYAVACPACRRAYSCDGSITATRIT